MDTDPRLSIQSMTVEINNGFLDTTSTLTIPSVDRADAGNYTCVASNTVFGSLIQDVQQFMLKVNRKCLTAMHVVAICQCYSLCFSFQQEKTFSKGVCSGMHFLASACTLY